MFPFSYSWLFFPADFVLLFLILLIANYSIWLFYESLLHLLIIQSLICFLSKYFFNLIFLDLLLLLMLLLLQFLVWILLLLLLVLLALSPPLSSRLPPPVLLLSLLSLPPSFPNLHWPPSLPPALPHSIPPSLTQSHSLTPSFINTRSLQKNHMSHPWTTLSRASFSMFTFIYQLVFTVAYVVFT